LSESPVKTIVFFGSPSSAIPSLEHLREKGYRISLIITQPDKRSGRGRHTGISPVKNFALDHGIPVYQPLKIRRDPAALDRIREAGPDLNVVVAFGQIIPSEIIYFPRFNSVNVHFSLLPKYRGASPVQWTLLNGEDEAGITIFELNERMDEGDILSQESVPILPEENAPLLEARLSRIGAELLIRTIRQIDEIKKVEQDSSKATHAPLIKKQDGRIDWKNHAGYLERQIKAFAAWPSTFTFFRGSRIKILKGHRVEAESSPAKPGEIVAVDSLGIRARCGGLTSLLIEELQPENKKPMSAYSFCLGARIHPGEIFS